MDTTNINRNTAIKKIINMPADQVLIFMVGKAEEDAGHPQKTDIG